ncbi:hypothetical protein B0H14DRAFT_2645690 [Mycena olivaceomarginata]|nr:hypothetical protein B0H14DRAFT_2645690 [Mycena olivaceomarginata]
MSSPRHLHSCRPHGWAAPSVPASLQFQGIVMPGEMGMLTEEMQALDTSDYQGYNVWPGVYEEDSYPFPLVLKLRSRTGSVMSGVLMPDMRMFRSLSERDLEKADAALSQEWAIRHGGSILDPQSAHCACTLRMTLTWDTEYPTASLLLSIATKFMVHSLYNHADGQQHCQDDGLGSPQHHRCPHPLKFQSKGALEVLKYMLLCKVMLNLPEDMHTLVSIKLTLKYMQLCEVESMRAITWAHQDRNLDKLSSELTIRSHLAALYNTLLESPSLCPTPPLPALRLVALVVLLGWVALLIRQRARGDVPALVASFPALTFVSDLAHLRTAPPSRLSSFRLCCVVSDCVHLGDILGSCHFLNALAVSVAVY